MCFMSDWPINLLMWVKNWPNIFVDQGQFSDISGTYQIKNVQFADTLLSQFHVISGLIRKGGFWWEWPCYKKRITVIRFMVSIIKDCQMYKVKSFFLCYLFIDLMNFRTNLEVECLQRSGNLSKQTSSVRKHSFCKWFHTYIQVSTLRLDWLVPTCLNYTYTHVSTLRRGHRDRMVVGFTTTSAITTKVVSFNPVHGEVYLIHHYVIKVCQWLATGRWFSQGTPASFANKTYRHVIIEMLLKKALNTINQTKPNQTINIKACLTPTRLNYIWANKKVELLVKGTRKNTDKVMVIYWHHKHYLPLNKWKILQSYCRGLILCFYYNKQCHIGENHYNLDIFKVYLYMYQIILRYRSLLLGTELYLHFCFIFHVYP